MKIALVDTTVEWHNFNYLNAILDAIKNNEDKIKVVLILPDIYKYKLDGKNIILYQLQFPIKTKTLKYLIDRAKWIYTVNKIIIREQVQLVHFLTGDSIYQLAGIFLEH